MNAETPYKKRQSFLRMEFLTAVNRFMLALAGYMIVGLLFYNVYATCARYFFNAPVPGSTEISTLLIPVIVFLGLSWNLEAGKHICVDVFVSRLTERKQIFLRFITTIPILIFGAILLWKGGELSYGKFDELSSSELELPLFPFYAFIPLGGILLLLQSIRNLLRYLGQLKTKQQRTDA